jgi:choline monooxygenase
LTGELAATPYLKLEKAKKDALGLKTVRSAVWMDVIFVNVSGDAQPFEEWIAPLEQRWAPFMGHALFYPGHASGGRGMLEPQCNWKLAVENYCESYHLPWIHPGLNSYSKLEVRLFCSVLLCDS